MIQPKYIKTIYTAQGFRIVDDRYTLVVGMPRLSNPTFYVHKVVTDGIHGKPQLTFDSFDAAKSFLEAHHEFEDMRIGPTNKTYKCVRVPLSDGFEGWVDFSQFPPVVSPKDRRYAIEHQFVPMSLIVKFDKQWEFYLRLFPDYFEKIEDDDVDDLNEEYEELHVNAGQSWKVKTQGEYCYHIKINIPTVSDRKNTFSWRTVSQNPFGGGASYQEACFLTKQEAEEFIRRYRLNEEHPYPGHQGDWYAYSARVNLDLVKVPLEDGYEVYMRTEAFPHEYNSYTGQENLEGHAWWEKVRRLFPRYFGTQPVRRIGFFNESIERNFANNPDEIRNIMYDEDLTEDQKCRKLFNRSWSEVQKYMKGLHSDVFDSGYNYNERTRRIDAAQRDNGVRVRTLLCEDNFSDILTLTQSFDYYVEGHPSFWRHSSRAYPTLLTPTQWWGYFKDIIEMWEDILIKPIHHTIGFFREDVNTKFDFFSESLTTNWLRSLGTTYEEVKELADKNFNCEFVDPETEEELGYCVTGDSYDGDSAGIVSPWYDTVGMGPFNSLQEICDYYGEEWTKDWIEGFLKWLEDNRLWSRHTVKRVGFFSESYLNETILNFTGEQVREIMQSDLTDDEKSMMLFRRPISYMYEVGNLLMLLQGVIVWKDYEGYVEIERRINTEANYYPISDYTKRFLLNSVSTNNYEQLKNFVVEIQNCRHTDSGKWSLLFGSGPEHPLTLEESWNEDSHVISGEDTADNRYEAWWKTLIEEMEFVESKGLTSKKRNIGFFNVNEDLNNPDFRNRADDIIAIVHNDNLTEDQKCQKLWSCRLSDVLKTENDNYQLRWCPDRARSETPNSLGFPQQYSVFIVNSDSQKLFTLKESFSFYCERGFAYGYQGRSYTPVGWWEHINMTLDHWSEESGQSYRTFRRIGFFSS